MAMSSTKLALDIEHRDGTSYSVTVESGLAGRVRMVVEAEPDDGTESRYQGADLTPEECRYLAKVLQNTADLVDAEGPSFDELLAPDSTMSSLVEWLVEEFGGKVITVMPSMVDVTPAGETYWVVFEHDGQRSIEWVVGLKTISEVEGPSAYDCPLYFFDLVPPANTAWRSKCQTFQK